MNWNDLILPQLLLQSHNHIACPVKAHIQDMLENKDPEGWATNKKTSCDNVVENFFSIKYMLLQWILLKNNSILCFIGAKKGEY